MILYLFLILSFCNLLLAENQVNKDSKKRKTVDRVLAIVYTPEGMVPICQADLRPGIDGTPRTLKDVILNNLVLMDGKKSKILKDDNDSEQKEEDAKYLYKIQKQHKLTNDDIIELFKGMGYTYEEGLKELHNMRVTDTVLDIKVRSKIMPDKKDIEKYCAENPAYVYVLSSATLPYEEKINKKEQLEKIDKDIKTGEIVNSITWDGPFDIKETGIASEKAHIKNMKVNDIKLEEDNDGIKLLRLVEKKEETAQERSKEVAHLLSKDRFENFMDKYQKGLFANSHIKYMTGVEPVDKL